MKCTVLVSHPLPASFPVPRHLQARTAAFAPRSEIRIPIQMGGTPVQTTVTTRVWEAPRQCKWWGTGRYRARVPRMDVGRAEEIEVWERKQQGERGQEKNNFTHFTIFLKGLPAHQQSSHSLSVWCVIHPGSWRAHFFKKRKHVVK